MDLSSQHNQWFFTSSEAGCFATPEAVDAVDWLNAVVPGTVAQSLQQLGGWKLDAPIDFDEQDWWFKTQFNLENLQPGQVLCFDGLATLADVWLNGQHILSSENMFLGHRIAVDDYLQKHNQLIICFRSLSEKLKQRHPRPRWKTKLVSEQTLRWYRTTLLGRIPGWTPAVTAVGPWRSIYLSRQQTPNIIRQQARYIGDQHQGHAGSLDVHYQLLSDQPIRSAQLVIDKKSYPLTISQLENGMACLTGQLTLAAVEPWWPHTHGTPQLYPVTLEINSESHAQTFSLGQVGFKQVRLETSEEEFAFDINGTKIFCRGACWTCNDMVSLTGNKDKLKQQLTLMRDAGANMIRIGGTMVYEQQAFYQMCDQLGILVWQDFMFANMDYPFEDPKFLASVTNEISQVAQRLSRHASVAIFCGSSEIEQQVAMLGFDQSYWQSEFFQQQLPQILKNEGVDLPYVSSSPTGGSLPFHTHSGLSHYYGVGAYLRPVSEVRNHRVKFTSECLGFANIPCSKVRNSLLDGQLPASHDPRWKQGTPRDSGTGWDFEDVRDHYLGTLFNLDPVALRSFDSERYFRLSEVVTGKLMSQVFAEWRSAHSKCAGGLVWFMNDLRPGAGWGILDSDGAPKACYYYLKRRWQSVNLSLTDESLSGLDIHLNNEMPHAFTGQLSVHLLGHQDQSLAEVQVDVTIGERETQCYNLDTLLGRFYDTTYSYRFGPAHHKLVAVSLHQNGQLISEDFYFPENRAPTIDPHLKVKTHLVSLDEKTLQLEVSSEHLLYAVTIDTPYFIADNNFFNLLPNTSKLIKLTRKTGYSGKFRGYLSALNLPEDIRLKTPSS